MSVPTRQTILFDIDGTLIDAAGAGQAAMAAAMVQLFGEPPSASDRRRGRIRCAGRTDRAIAQDYFLWHGVQADDAQCAFYYETFLGLLRDYLPRHPGCVLPGVVPLLQLLQRCDHVEIGLLTGNLRHAARMKLEHYGLSQFFYTPDDPIAGFGDWHHDRCDMAREALASLQAVRGCDIDMASIWVVGDTPNDVQCARAIGARVVAVATGTYTREQLAATEPDLLFEDLTECDGWLTQLGLEPLGRVSSDRNES